MNAKVDYSFTDRSRAYLSFYMEVTVIVTVRIRKIYMVKIGTSLALGKSDRVCRVELPDQPETVCHFHRRVYPLPFAYNPEAECFCLIAG